MHDPLNDLANLTDALYQAELSKMREVNAREASLRHDLAELESLQRSNMALPQADLHTVRQIGADVLWEGWVSRTRADLNMQLAQVMAQKARMTTQLRRAFGKQIAAAELLRKADDEKRQRREKRRWQNQDDLQLMKSSKP